MTDNHTQGFKPELSPKLLVAPLKFFSESHAMELRTVPNTSLPPGYFIHIRAAKLDADATKEKGRNAYAWTDAIDTGLTIEAMLGFLMVARRHRDEYEVQTGATKLSLKRQGTEYANLYPMQLTVLHQREAYRARLTPGNTAAFINLLAVAASKSQGLSIGEMMRLLDMGV